ncbi:MAG TPA: nucleotidyltransferase family protein [Actinomycetota bacterium]
MAVRTEIAPETVVRRVAGFGLAGSGSLLVVEPLDRRAWASVLDRVSEERILGLAAAAVHAGTVAVTEEQRTALLERHREAMLVALILERTLLGLTDRLRAGGVAAVVLKGPAVAHTVYRDPAWRQFGDIDLLVRTEDLRAACRVLVAEGLRRRVPEPRPGFDERFGKGVEFGSDGLIEVDLHRTLALGPFGLWIDPGELIDHAVGFSLAGSELQRLDRAGQFLHACMHAVLGSRRPRLLPLRDVAQLAEDDEVDWDLVDDRAERWTVGAVLVRAVRTASRALGWTPPPRADELVARVPVTRRQQRALAAYAEGSGAGIARAVATTQAIPGLAAKTSYLRALLLPDHAFLAARAGAGLRPSYVRRWITPAKRRLGQG